MFTPSSSLYYVVTTLALPPSLLSDRLPHKVLDTIQFVTLALAQRACFLAASLTCASVASKILRRDVGGAQGISTVGRRGIVSFPLLFLVARHQVGADNVQEHKRKWTTTAARWEIQITGQ